MPVFAAGGERRAPGSGSDDPASELSDERCSRLKIPLSGIPTALDVLEVLEPVDCSLLLLWEEMEARALREPSDIEAEGVEEEATNRVDDDIDDNDDEATEDGSEGKGGGAVAVAAETAVDVEDVEVIVDVEHAKGAGPIEEVSNEDEDEDEDKGGGPACKELHRRSGAKDECRLGGVPLSEKDRLGKGGLTPKKADMIDLVSVSQSHPSPTPYTHNRQYSERYTRSVQDRVVAQRGQPAQHI